MIKLLKFGSKEENAPILGKGFVPTDRVKELSEKGFSEPEMIDVLRKEGFSAEEIDRALTQALKIGVTGVPEPTTHLPTMDNLQPQAPQMPQMPEKSLQYAEPQYPPQGGYGTEELVESVVQERMSEVNQRLTELNMKQSNLERTISNLHNQLSNISKSRTQTDQVIINKIESFKDILTDINARMSSLEKAFKDALPALIESVRALTNLVQRFKKE